MSKNSTARSKTETELNIKFVQKVQKYLVLYDKTIECYSYENDVDEAWNEVADYMGVSVSDCKKKWIIIRQALKRNLCEKENTNKKNVKYHYLVPHLKFLIPFLKNRKIYSSLITGEKNSKSSSDDVDSIDDDDEFEEVGDLDRLREAKRKQKKDKYYDSSIRHENHDMSFLRSLLPDLELMSTRQKHKFKIGVLNLISDIQGQNENHTELESNSNLRISKISKQEFVIKEEETC